MCIFLDHISLSSVYDRKTIISALKQFSRERSSAIAYQSPVQSGMKYGAQQEVQWTKIASFRRWISNERGEKDVGCCRGTGLDWKSRMEER